MKIIKISHQGRPFARSPLTKGLDPMIWTPKPPVWGSKWGHQWAHRGPIGDPRMGSKTP